MAAGKLITTFGVMWLRNFFGTWTPTIGGATSESGQVYSGQSGHYIRIGSHVYIHGAVTLSTLGTITGNVRVKGLPFTVSATNGNFRQCPVLFDTLTTAVASFCGFFVAGGTSVEMRMVTAAAVTGGTSTSMAVVQQANLSNTTSFFLSGWYHTSD